MTEGRSTKHLEMLQTSIARLAGYSFVAKGWSVTLATAMLGIAAEEETRALLLVGGLAVLLFWLIDAYYLSLERGFRDLFKAAATRLRVPDTAETFDMAPTSDFGSLLHAAVRPAVLMVHPPLLLALALAALLVDHSPPTG